MPMPFLDGSSGPVVASIAKYYVLQSEGFIVSFAF